MPELNKLDAKLKMGDEKLTYNDKETSHTLLEFWRWNSSDLMSNATRGRFAEFIVASALGLKRSLAREEWDAFDIITDEGIKIEIKSASFIQSWKQIKLSTISFGIAPTVSWIENPKGKNQRGELKRQADVYVFCLLKHKEQNTIDPLKLEQWEFYILPTSKLDKYSKTQKSISLNPLKSLAKPTDYQNLKTEIDNLTQNIL